MPSIPRILTGVLAAGALALTAAPAGASSLVYVKDGDVWLSSPDAAKQYRVTYDSGYASPSQADDGTIVAWRAKQFVRMDRSGHRLNAPVDGIGTDPAGGQFFGPYEPKVSPDGKRIAYWFGQYSEYYNHGCNCYLFHLENLSTWTWADHFKPHTDDGYAKGIEQPSWLTNDRVFATYPGFHMAAWTWKLESGQPNYDAQWAFSLRDPDGTYRLDLGDGEVSPDGSKIALTAGGDSTSKDQLWLFTTSGPLWAGEPPYDNFAQSDPIPAQPDARCAGTVGKIVSPTWSPASDAVAYSLADGVHVINVGDIATSCAALTEALVAAGGAEPDWGPADVDMARAPAPPPPGSSPSAGTGATKLALTRVSLPRAFKAARKGAAIIASAGGKLRFTLSEPARLTLTARHGKRRVGSIKTAGKPGANAQRFTGRVGGRSLRRGRYTLTLAATDLTGREHARASVRFRITR
jgi:hypothetical protein